MKILIVGGEGTIGRALKAEFSRRHEVVSAGRQSGDITLDITSDDSIRAAYEKVGDLDAVACVAASGALDDFSTLTTEDLLSNLRGKLFGQIALVLIGQKYLRDGGSFALTSGIFADVPYKGVTAGGLLSGALHSFVLSAAIELSRGLRVNAISPSMVEDSAEKYASYFPGLKPVPMQMVVDSFVAALETKITGQVLKAYSPRAS